MIKEGVKLNFKEWQEKNMSKFDQYFLSFYADSVIQIKKKMIELNLGQRELAEMTGLKQPAISRMLNMDAVPRIDTMMKVMYAIGIELRIENKEEE